jgi:hypothetical protein
MMLEDQIRSHSESLLFIFEASNSNLNSRDGDVINYMHSLSSSISHNLANPPIQDAHGQFSYQRNIKCME